MQSLVLREFSGGNALFEYKRGGVVHNILIYQASDGELVDFLVVPDVSHELKATLIDQVRQVLLREGKPLFIRFQESLFREVLWIAGRRVGFSHQGVQLIGTELEYKQGPIHGSFSCRFDPTLIAEVESILLKEEETEENSIKFGHLPPDEIELWRKKKPSYELLFELSVFGDLAKLLFLQAEVTKTSFKVSFENEPGELVISLPKAEVSIKLSRANWDVVIPKMRGIDSNIVIHSHPEGDIESIVFEKSSFHPQIRRVEYTADVLLGEWIYSYSSGFFPRNIDPLFSKKTLSIHEIAQLIKKGDPVLERALFPLSVERKVRTISYIPSIEKDGTFLFRAYLERPGDLTEVNGYITDEFVCIPNRGFIEISYPEFTEVEKRIPSKEVPSFIESHRSFLQRFDGFQVSSTHLDEVAVHFDVDDALALHFSLSMKMAESGDGVFDYGVWVYVPGRGFLQKSVGVYRALLEKSPIAKEEVSLFIREHKETLELIKGFFMKESPLEQYGLMIRVNKDELIEIRPESIFHSQYIDKKPVIFGDAIYIRSEGFYLFEMAIPKPYTERVVISQKEEFHFLTHDLPRLQPVVSLLDKRLRKPQKIEYRLLSLENQKKGLRVEVELITEFGSTPISDIVEALREKKTHMLSRSGLLLLREGHWQWIREIQDKIQPKGQFVISFFDFYKFLHAHSVHAPQGDKGGVQQKLETLLSFQAETSPDLSLLSSHLRPYQQKGVEWLWFLYQHSLSGLLCDEMGLGKSHQAMGLVAAIRKEEIGGKILIVCPTSVIFHWQDLLHDFLPTLQVNIFYGASRTLTEGDEIIVTSYGIIRSEKDAFISKHFSLIIFDEVQVAKNIKSQTHQVLRHLRADMRVGLTGTPLENRVAELKAIFDVVIPRYLPSQQEFKRQFIQPIEKEGNEQAKKELAELISPFMLRRKKLEVLKDLPEKIEEVRACVMSDLQKSLYKELFTRSKEQILSEIEHSNTGLIHAFALITKLKQLCNHPALYLGQIDKYAEYSSGKWELFTELLDEIIASEQKVVVFSQYLGMLEIMENYLQSIGIEYAIVQGSSSDRKEQLTRFKEESGCKVFLASLRAVGVGVDLTSASYVIHYDRWWNPAVENQATDRVHRMGQKRGVQVMKLVTRHSIEEHIDALIQEKLALFESLIGFDDSEQLKRISKEELVKLFGQIEQDIQSYE